MEQNKHYEHLLEGLKLKSNFRHLPDKPATEIVDFCSNDYLGLTSDISLYEEFISEMNRKKYAFGGASSRLLSGNNAQYTELEELISAMYAAEECLIFNSGYHANTGILKALATKSDLIVADKLVHASLIDGIRLSDAEHIRFRHLDYSHLELILEREYKNYDRVFIVTESIFSMDGDMADMHKLVYLKEKFNCFLYVDEAHAVGIRGVDGLGLCEETGCLNEVDILLGTFGKALASVGAFVVCNKQVKDMLVNFARTLIYTTALPPVNLAWTRFIMEKLPGLSGERKRLKVLSEKFTGLLKSRSTTHIIPYIIGENKKAIEIADSINQQGFHVLPIRYPTVPHGTARLRFSLNAGMHFDKIKNIQKMLPV